MSEYFIDDKRALIDLKEYIKEENLKIIKRIRNKDNKLKLILSNKVNLVVEPIYEMEFEENLDKDEFLVFGKNNTERVVSVEIEDDKAILFKETESGVETEEVDNKFWITYPMRTEGSVRLKGNLHYRWYKDFDNREEFELARKESFKKGGWSIKHPQESFMVKNGFTYFKGLRVEDVSVLSFDIEATSLTHNENSKVLLISNTFRKNGKIIKKLFSYDEYKNDGDMLNAWCDWVRTINPSILIGHNIFTYDLPYMDYCIRRNGYEGLNLGRNDTLMTFNDKPSNFRKDGSQTYEYYDINIYGREIIDTMFLAIKADIGRKYESYGLKQIIAQEGLEKEDRTHYDASLIGKNYTNPKEFAKIKEYAKDDADDSLALYDLMASNFFYYTQSVPKTFQQVINTATGSQFNAIMVRAYLQQGHSLPDKTEVQKFEGGISFGNPGIYKNVRKIDVASLYPSIMREYKVFDKDKDPNGYFLRLVDYFTLERLKNKAKGNETGDRYFKDLEQSQKIVINSAYGFMGAPGLLFNSPKNAAFVTRKGREILSGAIDWAKDLGYEIVNADTDSISYSDGKKIDIEQFESEIENLNTLYPEKIIWENDGVYKKVIVVKAKNYILDDGKKVKIKGSALKATNKEKELQKYIKELIGLLLKDRHDQFFYLYNHYVHKILNIKDITGWCTKKTITDKVLNPKRTNEQKVLDAIQGVHVQEGDKIYVFFKEDGSLCLRENFDEDYDEIALLKKLYKTTEVFSNLLGMGIIPDYSLTRNRKFLTFLGNCDIVKELDG